MEDIKKTFEIKIGEKTFISKKINLTRRALFLKKIVANSTPETKIEDSEFKKIKSNTETMANLLETSLPEVAWEFIKDEDKKDITFDYFKEEVDDICLMEFMRWGLKCVNQIQGFLVGDQQEM